MNMKKIVIILSILIIGIGVLTPVSAFSINKLDSFTVSYKNGETTITTDITSQANSYYKRSKDLNQISKVVITVNGKKIRTIGKGIGWHRYEYYPNGIVDSNTKFKGTPIGKKVTITAYNSKNKIIKQRTDVIKTYTKHSLYYPYA